MTAQRLGLECLDRGVAVVIAENVCEAVRVLATTPVSLIAIDLDRVRLRFADQAALFDRVAPGVRVAVTAPSTTALQTRVGLELAGFHVVSDPDPEELLKLLE